MNQRLHTQGSIPGDLTAMLVLPALPDTFPAAPTIFCRFPREHIGITNWENGAPVKVSGSVVEETGAPAPILEVATIERL